MVNSVGKSVQIQLRLPVCIQLEPHFVNWAKLSTKWTTMIHFSNHSIYERYQVLTSSKCKVNHKSAPNVAALHKDNSWWFDRKYCHRYMQLHYLDVSRFSCQVISKFIDNKRLGQYLDHHQVVMLGTGIAMMLTTYCNHFMRVIWFF